MSSQTRLVSLWCPVCKKMTVHRVNLCSEPRCLQCEDETLVLPPPIVKETKIQYPLR